MLRKTYFALVLMLAFVGLPHITQAGNSHNVPTGLPEIQAREGDHFSPYIVSGCAPTVPSPASLTFTSGQMGACNGYVRGASSDLVYVTQAAAAVGPLNAGNGTYWLAIHRDTSTTVAGWTRQAGTHYLTSINATQPANPSGGYVFARVTVSGGVITAVRDQRALDPVEARTGVYNAVNDGFSPFATAAANSTALAATIARALPGSTIQLPSGSYTMSTGVSITKPLIIQGLETSHGAAEGTEITYTGSGALFQFSAVRHVGLKNLRLILSGTNTAQILHVAGVWFGEYTNLLLATASNNQEAIRITNTDAGSANFGSYFNIFRSVRTIGSNNAANTADYGVYIRGTGGPNVTHTVFINSWITNHGGDGLNIDGSDTMIFEGVSVENNLRHAYNITNMSQPIWIGGEVAAPVGFFGFNIGANISNPTWINPAVVLTDNIGTMSGSFSTYPINGLIRGNNILTRQPINGIVDTGIIAIAKWQGFIYVVDQTDGDSGIIELRGNSNGVRLIESAGGRFTTTAGNAGTINIYYSPANDRYEIENRRGLTINIAYGMMGGSLLNN